MRDIRRDAPPVRLTADVGRILIRLQCAEGLALLVPAADIRLRLDHQVEAGDIRTAGDKLGHVDAHVAPRSLLVEMGPDRVDDQAAREPGVARIAMEDEIRPTRAGAKRHH